MSMGQTWKLQEETMIVEKTRARVRQHCHKCGGRIRKNEWIKEVSESSGFGYNVCYKCKPGRGI